MWLTGNSLAGVVQESWLNSSSGMEPRHNTVFPALGKCGKKNQERERETSTEVLQRKSLPSFPTGYLGNGTVNSCRRTNQLGEITFMQGVCFKQLMLQLAVSSFMGPPSRKGTELRPKEATLMFSTYIREWSSHQSLPLFWLLLPFEFFFSDLFHAKSWQLQTVWMPLQLGDGPPGFQLLLPQMQALCTASSPLVYWHYCGGFCCSFSLFKISFSLVTIQEEQ